jgi:hypothetical protein
MLDVGGSFRRGAEAAGRIRRWVEEILPAEETATLLVTQLTCSEPDCPPIETVIALIGGPAPRTWKIPRPATEITAGDVAAALARLPDAAHAGHAPRPGCCDIRPQDSRSSGDHP